MSDSDEISPTICETLQIPTNETAPEINPSQHQMNPDVKTFNYWLPVGYPVA